MLNSAIRYIPLLFFHSLLWMLTPGIYAQNITISEEVSVKTDFSYNILGKFNDRVLLFRDQSNNYEVQAFDDEMRLFWTKQLNFDHRRPEIIGLTRFDEMFHIFYGYREKGDYIIKHQAYNGKAELVDSVTLTYMEKQYFSPRFKFSESEDHSKVLLFKSDKESELDIFAYDLRTMELIWQKHIYLKNTFLRRDFRSMIASNEGDMYMLLEHEKAFSTDIDYELVTIDATTRELKQREFTFGEKVIHDFFPVYDNLNKQLVMAGLYSERNIARAEGIYFSVLRDDAGKPETIWHGFTDPLLQDIYGKEVSEDRGVSNFNIRDIALRQDGGAMIVAEQSKEYSRRTSLPVRRDYASYNRGSWVDYYYEDLIVLSVHPEGYEHWSMVLHKKQHSQDDDAMFSSYFLFKTPQKIRLLYNDEIRNENTVSEYVIRGNGYHERNSVFSTDYHRLKLRFKDAVQVAYNECIVPSERNNRLNLVRIKY